MSKDSNLDHQFKEYLKNIDEDKSFKKFLRRKQELSDKTIRNYRNAVKKFCICYHETFDEMIIKFKNERKSITEKINETQYVTHEFKMEDSLIQEYQEEFIEYLQTVEFNNKKLKNRTINDYVKSLKAVLGVLGIETPTFKKLEIDESDWELLTKEDLKYVLDQCTIHYKSFLTFAVSTGFRLNDCLSLTVGDFIKATEEYHNVREVDEFLEKVEGKKLMGKWNIIPHKTRKLKIKQTTYNSPESSEFIIMALKDRNKFMERKNRDEGTNLKLQKTDALFGSKQLEYKKPPLDTSVDGYFKRKSDNLRQKRVQELQNKLNDGDISQETYDEDVKRIPKVNPHRFRKYYCSVINRYTQNIRIAGAMEGHKTGLPTDQMYIKLFDEDIKKTYESALNELTITKDILNTEEMKKMEKKHQKEMEKLKKQFKKQLDDKLKEQKESYEEKINRLEGENSSLSSRVTDIKDQMDTIEETLFKNDIKEIMNYASHNKVVNKNDLLEIVMDLYDTDYKAKKIRVVDDEYKQKLINRALIVKKKSKYKWEPLEEFDAKLSSLYKEKYSSLKKIVCTMKREILEIGYPGLNLTPKSNSEINYRILFYIEDLIEANKNPEKKHIEEIILDHFDTESDINIIDKLNYVKEKEQKQATKEESEKLQKIAEEKGKDEAKLWQKMFALSIKKDKESDSEIRRLFASAFYGDDDKNQD